MTSSMPNTPPTPPGFHALLQRDPDAIRCPFPAYTELRDAPITYVPELGAYVVSRYEDIVEVLLQPDVFSSEHVTGPRSATGLAQQLVDGRVDLTGCEYADDLLRLAQRRLDVAQVPAVINVDPPDHTRQRKLIRPAFAPRRVNRLEPRVRAIADDLADAFVGGAEAGATGHTELVANFCLALPMLVIADALGVPPEDRDRFKVWSDAFVVALGNPDMGLDETHQMLQHIDEAYDYLSAQLADRRANPRDDLMTDVATAELDGETPLTHAEQLQIIVLLLVGGNETTANLLGNSLLRLLGEPELCQRLRSEPDTIDPFIEEMLRLDPPITGLFRSTTCDTRIGDVELPAGAFVYLAYISGNHDEARFGFPEALDLERENGRPKHLAFGMGEHLCLGAPLARAEARIGLTTLFDRLSDITLDCDLDEVPFHPSMATRGPRELPVRFTVR